MKKLIILLILSVFCLNLNSWHGGWSGGLQNYQYVRPYNYYPYGGYYGYGYPYYGSGVYLNAGPIGFGIGF